MPGPTGVAAAVPLLALIPLALGLFLASHWLKEERWLVRLALAISLATSLSLLPLNALLSFTELGLTRSLVLIFGVQIAIILGLARRKVARGVWDRAQWWAALPALAITLCTVALRLMSTDDDYYVHTPVQGVLSRGIFPPRNPFFIEIPLNGHYGRDLFMGACSAALGCYVQILDVLLTPLWQACTYVLLWATLQDKERPGLSHLAPALVFLGINCGLNSGLTFLPFNNNPLAYLYVATIFWCIQRHQQRPGAATAVIGGLVLGGLAIVYETHFGLSVLATASAFVLLGPSWARFRPLLAPALIALALALTQGGPLTHLAHRKKSEPALSQGMQNQSQVVVLKVPKPELGQIKLYSDNNRQARLSLFYHYFAPRALKELRPEAGYTPIWSWEFLKLQFLPVYLAPLTGWVLWRRRHAPGVWLWCFGFWAFAVPALVNFGPVYESEYMRWEFAAALAWAACLGIVARWNRAWWPAVALCLLPAWPTTTSQVQNFLAWPGPKWWVLLPPNSSDWLAYQGDPEFHAQDVAAAQKLRELSQPGDRMLIDSSQENHKNLVYEATFTGISGVRCVGHHFPLDEEEIGLPPFRLAPATSGFWAHPRLDLLQQLGVQWVLRRCPTGAPPLPGLPPPLVFADATLERQLYSLQVPPDPRRYDPQPARPLNLQLSGPQSARARCVYSLTLSQPAPCRLALASAPDQQLDPRNWLWNPAGSELQWCAPVAAGEHQLQLYGQDESGVFPVEGQALKVSVDYEQRLGTLQPRFTFPSQAQPNEVIRVQVDCQAPWLRKEPDNRWLVALQFVPSGPPRRVDLEQGPRSRVQRLQPDENGRLEVVGQVPALAGRYQILLVFAADAPRYQVRPVGELEVIP